MDVILCIKENLKKILLFSGLWRICFHAEDDAWAGVKPEHCHKRLQKMKTISGLFFLIAHVTIPTVDKGRIVPCSLWIRIKKEMKLKDRLPGMDEEEQLKLLATDGMLVKRPLVVDGNVVLTGFKEGEWEEKLL